MDRGKLVPRVLKRIASKLWICTGAGPRWADWRMTGCGLSESTSKWVRITWACQCRRNDLSGRAVAREEFPSLRGLCKTAIAFCRLPIFSFEPVGLIISRIDTIIGNICISDFLEGKRFELKLCPSILVREKRKRRFFFKDQFAWFSWLAAWINQINEGRGGKNGREMFEDPGYRVQVVVTRNFITRRTKGRRGNGRVTRLIN